jgi:hypothetical protein
MKWRCSDSPNNALLLIGDISKRLVNDQNSNQNVHLVVRTSKTKLNSVASIRDRTIPTERPPLVGEVIANFWGLEGVAWSARRIRTAVFSAF